MRFGFLYSGRSVYEDRGKREEAGKNVVLPVVPVLFLCFFYVYFLFSGKSRVPLRFFRFVPVVPVHPPVLVYARLSFGIFASGSQAFNRGLRYVASLVPYAP